jgi:hypothetical protein
MGNVKCRTLYMKVSKTKQAQNSYQKQTKTNANIQIYYIRINAASYMFRPPTVAIFREVFFARCIT